jgi:branched-chain amino acid transport system substrate-binding protein
MAAVAGLKKAGDLDTEKLVSAFEGLEFGTPLGKTKFRPQDHQSTMGAYVGTTALKDGKGIMTNYRYIDGASVQPSDSEVAKLRAAD